MGWANFIFFQYIHFILFSTLRWFQIGLCPPLLYALNNKKMPPICNYFGGGGGYLVLQTLLGWGSAFGLISWVPGGIIPFGGSFTFTSSPASINKQRLSYKKIKNTGNISQTVPAEHAKEPLSCFTNGTCRYLTICYFLNIYTVTWKFTDKELYVLFRHLSQIVSIALLGNFVSY